MARCEQGSESAGIRPASPSVIGELVITRALMDPRISAALAAGDVGLVHDLEIASAHVEARLADEMAAHIVARGFEVPAEYSGAERQA